MLETPTERFKIWLLTNAPSPYQAELLAAVADRQEINLSTRYMHEGRGQMIGESNGRVMRGFGLSATRDELRVHPLAVWECLLRPRDCYVLSGLWTSPTFLLCAFVLWCRRQPWVLWLERPHAESSSTLIQSLTGVLRRIYEKPRGFLLARSTAILCIGTSARDSYASLGLPGDKLFVLPYCCDTGRFQGVRTNCGAEVRRRFALDQKIVLLFSGQMIPRKGVDTLIRIFEAIAAKYPNVALLLLGDGPERTNYEAMVPKRLRSRAHFAGFVPQADLPVHFAAADVFVFPSRHDGWGVVINEACAAGLPVVVSRQTGAARDLVEDGRSGFVIDCEDVDGFVDRLLLLIGNAALRESFGKRSRELVEPFSAENGAALFERHLRRVLGQEGDETGTETDLTQAS